MAYCVYLWQHLKRYLQLAKQRGFVFLSSEIYDGFAGVYDYGPLGVEMANNLKKSWWQTMGRGRPDIVGLDSGIVMHPKIWEASGHTTGFADPGNHLHKNREAISSGSPT